MPKSSIPKHEITEWLNYRDGDPTPDDIKMDAIHDADLAAEPVEAEPSDLSTEIIEYDPAHPGAILYEELAVACRDALRRFADSWINCGWEISRWELAHELENALSRRRPALLAGKPPTLYFEPPQFVDPEREGYSFAVWYFFDFITSPLSDRLGRCRACGDYFIARRKRLQMTYCSPKCGRKETAREAMQCRRAEEHQIRLKVVSQAVRDYQELPVAKAAKIGSGWKTWVADRASKLLKGPLRHYPIRAAFITRALNAGELKDPTE